MQRHKWRGNVGCWWPLVQDHWSNSMQECTRCVCEETNRMLGAVMEHYWFSSNAVHHVAKSITPIHDEISFVSKPDFEKLNHNLCHLMQKLHFPYGGMNIVFSGDMRQLEPFGEKRAVYQDDCPEFKDWVNCFIELTGMHRFKDDPISGTRLPLGRMYF